MVTLPRRLVRLLWNAGYYATLRILSLLNPALTRLRKNCYYSNSVLHISYMVHIPYFTVQILRKHGMKADYMAIGQSPVWNKCDYQISYSPIPLVAALQSFVIFWTTVAKYEIIHSHFMQTVSPDGWEIPILKKLGRKVVIHYRGCEARQRKKNIEMHPDLNICEECDYDAYCEKSELVKKRRIMAERYGDLFLVTTPDLKDFIPQAVHHTFFAPEIPAGNNDKRDDNSKVRIVHATNHPGIEGTSAIREAIGRLKEKGYDIEFIFLKGASVRTCP